MRVEYSDVMDDVVGPLQEKMDDWRRAATALDKDHAKGDFTVFSARNCNRMHINTLISLIRCYG